jgi:2-keto-4-pentenoate hydratase/2-oxohepta-3-ene-1,7-dioic acid hydratase in catechol pathway
MKLGRIAANGPDGGVARLVVAQPEQQRVIDLLTAERLRLQRQGATYEAALRLASALFPSSMAAAIALGDTFLEATTRAVASADAAAIHPLADVKLIAPLDPPFIRDFSAFEAHGRAMQRRMGKPYPEEFLKQPVYLKVSPFTVIGHEQEVPWPGYTEVMDYELELGFVIGKPGRDLLPEEALEHLVGVTIFNDLSARDIQGREMSTGLGPSKGKDFASALGPWIVTCDELDLNNLELVARVNGEEWSRGSSGTMTWKTEELIAYASMGETIWPGELLGSGTVGTGAGAEHGKQLQPGDVVELEVSGIGVLRNQIGQPTPRRWTPAPRPDHWEPPS